MQITVDSGLAEYNYILSNSLEVGEDSEYKPTNAQKDYAVFPQISGFFAILIGKQRYEEYVERSAFKSFPEVENQTGLNSKLVCPNYSIGVYIPAGHAQLDVNKNSQRRHERNREISTTVGCLEILEASG